MAWVVFEPQIASYNAGHAHHWTTGTPGHCCWPSLVNHNRCAYLLHCGSHDVTWHGRKIVRSRPYFPSTLMWKNSEVDQTVKVAVWSSDWMKLYQPCCVAAESGVQWRHTHCMISTRLMKRSWVFMLALLSGLITSFASLYSANILLLDCRSTFYC